MACATASPMWMIRLQGDMAQRSGRKVSLIGWSLGGLYARQLAKLRPDEVRIVVTLGSPFAAHPCSTNAWRVYELASGKRAGRPRSRFRCRLVEPPPVPTTAIFSRSDGVCAWRRCVERPSALTENIEVQGSHFGPGHHPAAVHAVADRLAQPEGQWMKFHRSGWRALASLSRPRSIIPTPPDPPPPDTPSRQAAPPRLPSKTQTRPPPQILEGREGHGGEARLTRRQNSPTT